MTNTIESKNNTAQLYLILGRAQQHWDFLTLLRDVPDIKRFAAGISKILTNATISKISDIKRQYSSVRKLYFEVFWRRNVSQN